MKPIYSTIIKEVGIPHLFKSFGLKFTKPREAILNIIYKSKVPLTAEDIIQKFKTELKDIDRATVYRTLEFFTKSRLVLKIDLRRDSFLYEMNNAHHHHIVCNSCGIIEEIEYCELPNPMIQSKKFSFVSDHSLEFFGKCKTCANL